MPITIFPTVNILWKESVVEGPWTWSNEEDLPIEYVYTEGSSSGQVNKLHAKRYTLAAGGLTNLDLSGVTLTNFRGQPIAFTKTKLIAIRLATATAGAHVNIGGSAAPAEPFVAATTTRLHPLGTFLDICPLGRDVVNAVSDTIRLHNQSSVSVDVDVVIAGS